MIKRILFPLLFFFFQYTLASDSTLIVSLTPGAAVSFFSVNFPGIYERDFYSADLTEENFSANSYFSPYIQPALNLQLYYGAFKAGADYNFDFVLLPAKAVQYDEAGNPRYYITRDNEGNLIQSDNKIGAQFRAYNHTFYFSYMPSLQFQIDFIYNYYSFEYNKSDNVQGLKLDSLGYKMNHRQTINTLGIGFRYNYVHNDWTILAIANYSPFLKNTVTYIDDIKEDFKGAYYSLSLQFNWKSIVFKYSYNSILTGNGAFNTRYHRFDMGFIWEALKIDLGEIDIFH